jgi:hypothetical protein
MLGVPGKIAALFAAMETRDLDEMPPAERRRFADMCRHWAAMAEPDDKPKAGVLALLSRGDRAQ